jgi:hypothetical protein
MTYELGQQVLVRLRAQPAPVQGRILDRADIAGGEAYLIFIDGWRVLVEAADIVGPVPATPDEGEAKLLPAESMALTVARAQVGRGENPEINVTAMLLMMIERLTATPDEGRGTIRAISDDMYTFRAQRDEARAALAAAEAERDAAAKVADDALEILDRLAAFGLHPEKQADLYERVAALRRALPVEAADTEGGGGHE